MRDIIINAKVSRPSVCNSLDTLIVNKDTPAELIRMILESLQKENVEIKMLSNEKELIDASSASDMIEEDFYSEWLSLICSIKVVS